jgi:hypothetical protein
MPELSYLFHSPERTRIPPDEAMYMVVYPVGNRNAIEEKEPVSVEEKSINVAAAKAVNPATEYSENAGTDKGKSIAANDGSNSEVNEKPTLPILVSFKFSIPKEWVECELELRLIFKSNGQVNALYTLSNEFIEL